MLGSGWYTELGTPGHSSSFSLSGISLLELNGRYCRKSCHFTEPGSVDFHKLPSGFLMSLEYPFRGLAGNPALVG